MDKQKTKNELTKLIDSIISSKQYRQYQIDDQQFDDIQNLINQYNNVNNESIVYIENCTICDNCKFQNNCIVNCINSQFVVCEYCILKNRCLIYSK